MYKIEAPCLKSWHNNPKLRKEKGSEKELFIFKTSPDVIVRAYFFYSFLVGISVVSTSSIGDAFFTAASLWFCDS